LTVPDFRQEKQIALDGRKTVDPSARWPKGKTAAPISSWVPSAIKMFSAFSVGPDGR
jgi:hypothetical protein